MSFPSELGSKDLNDYKNSKVYHDLAVSNFCIQKGDCRKSQSVNKPFRKIWIILEKSAKIRSCHSTCVAGIGETCKRRLM